MLKIRNFSSEAEMLVNLGVATSEKLRFNYLGSEHLLVAILSSNHPVVEKLRDKGITVESLTDLLQDMVDNDSSIRYMGSSQNDYITGDMVTDELGNIFASVINEALIEGRNVTGIDLIDALLRDNDCNAMKIIDNFDNSKSNGTKIPSSIAKYGKDLTALAKEGKLEPIIGREAEINRIINVLMRKKQV